MFHRNWYLLVKGITVYPELLWDFLPNSTSRLCGSAVVINMRPSTDTYIERGGRLLILPENSFCIEVDPINRKVRWSSEDEWLDIVSGSLSDAAEPVISSIEFAGGYPDSSSYPYDDISFSVQVIATFNLFSETGVHIPTSYSITSFIEGWEPIQDVVSNTDEWIEITLRRPLLVRILAPLLVLPLLLLAPLLLLLDSLSDAIEIAIALLVGVLAIRQILIPTSPPHLVALDLLIFGGIVAVMLAVFGSVLLHLRKGSKLN